MVEVSQLFNKILGRHEDYRGIAYWEEPERCGWLMKQGEFLSSWRRRWFVLKDGRLFWFKTDHVTQGIEPRGMIKIDNCLSIKGAEEAINRPFAFEVSTPDMSMYFIAESEKEKEDWINSVGRAIVRHSRCVMEQENVDYTG